MTGAEPTARTRRSRLTRSGDFDAVYRRGKSASGRYLVVYAFRREDASPVETARLGVSISRKIGGAVERNRLKRVLREQFATFADEMPRGTDFVAIARAGVWEYLEEQGSAALGARLSELARKAVGVGAGNS